MTTSQMYIKVDGTEITGAANISITKVMDGVDMATFQLPNYNSAISATWSAKKGQTVTVYNRDGGALLFYGFLKMLKHTNPLTVIAEGYIAKMMWYPLNQDVANFELDAGLVSDVATTTLSCQTNEGDDPDWGADEWNQPNQPRYVVVSDATNADNTLSYSADASSSVDDYTISGGTTYDKTWLSDTDYWSMYAVGDTLFKEAEIHFTIQSGNDDTGGAVDPIVKTAFLQTLSIECHGQVVASYAVAPDYWDAVFVIYWSHDGTTKDVLLYSNSVVAGNEVGGGTIVNFALPALVRDISGANESWFTKGATHWEAGSLIFSSVAQDDGIRMWWKINYAKIVVTYTTVTFDPVNALITDTTTDTGHDHLISATDFAAAGVSIGDKWCIGIGIWEAFIRSFTRSGLTHLINDGTVIIKGVTTDYTGYNEYELFITLCEIMDFHYWCTYLFNWPCVVANSEDNVAAAVTTYTDGFQFLPVVEEDDNEYGAVVVMYKEGLTAEVATGSSSPRVKLIKMRSVRTLTEATEIAERKAVYYANPHYSFEVSWPFPPTVNPQVGTKYNFTLADGTSYTDLICRRLSLFQDGGLGKWHIKGFFGGASTPPAESIGKRIGQLQRELSAQQSQLTSDAGVTRHAQLLGILGSSEANHVSAAERTAIGTAIQKGGSVTATADLPMGGFVHTGLGAGAANGESVRYEQIFSKENCCITVLNANITPTHANWTNLSWDGADYYDPSAMHNPASNADKIYIKKAGKYRVKCHVEKQASAGANNEGVILEIYRYNGGAGTSTYMVGNMNAPSIKSWWYSITEAEKVVTFAVDDACWARIYIENADGSNTKAVYAASTYLEVEFYSE